MADIQTRVNVKLTARLGRILALASFAALMTSVSVAQSPSRPDAPASLGFERFYKCPSDTDVTHLGDTITAKDCLAACEAQSNVKGCWWLDGTGGFPRECRACRTLQPNKMQWQNDWALPLSPYTA